MESDDRAFLLAITEAFRARGFDDDAILAATAAWKMKHKLNREVDAQPTQRRKLLEFVAAGSFDQFKNAEVAA